MDQEAPQYTPAQQTTTTTSPLAAKRDWKFIWGLICLIAPTALIVVSILLYAVANFILSSTTTSSASAILGEPSLGAKIVNITLFIVGSISVAAWLPGIIIGIVLLATRKK